MAGISCQARLRGIAQTGKLPQNLGKGSVMITRYAVAAVAAFGLSVVSVAAQTCGGVYTVQSGDSLSVIADSQYKNAGMWTAIHQNNVSVIGENPNRVRVGQKLNLTCINGLPTGLEGGRVQTASAEATAQPTAQPTAAVVKAQTRGIRFVTASDYAPFTDKNLPNEGLITDIVKTSMVANPDNAKYKVYWINDWSSHLDPLISDQLMDMGFPWFKPNCAEATDNWRCQNLVYSKPMFEALTLLFYAKERPIAFAKDEDMHGKTLCRPSGYFTFDLDQDGRNWLKDGKITLKQPQAVKACFDMLVAGEVDAVAINEFTGRAQIKDMGLKDQVEAVSTRPLSITGHHVVVHKDHPQAAELIAMVNAGLDAAKASGEYQKVLDAHMSRIWEDF